jgi:peroxiredoxin
MAKVKSGPIPEVGSEAPEFNLPAAQGGQLRLTMRTVRGPVVVVFFRGLWSEEDVEYFKALAGKEREINVAGATIAGIAKMTPDDAREFVRATGIGSYVLYDGAQVAIRDYGLSAEDPDHGEVSRPAAFIVDGDRKVVHAWIDEYPAPEELLVKVSEITGLPKEPEEGEEEKPRRKRRTARDGGEEKATARPERKKLSPEEREKRRAERKAAREQESAGAGEEKPAAEQEEPQKSPQPTGQSGEESARTDLEAGQSNEGAGRQEDEKGSEGERKE